MRPFLKLAKIATYARAIAFGKKVTLGQKLKLQKYYGKRPYKYNKVVSCKKTAPKKS